MLLGTPAGDAVRRRVQSYRLNAPHLMSVEVTQALRRLVSMGDVAGDVARACLVDLEALLIRRWRHEPFLQRAWELRSNITAYDGVYIALAETIDAPLLTTDGRLARSAGHRASIEVI